MDFSGTLAYWPLMAMALGAMAGIVAGRSLTGAWLWVLPGVLSLASLVLIVQLAAVQPGDEPAAFMPFVWLTGGVLPALFTVIMGTLGGRALRNRVYPA